MAPDAPCPHPDVEITRTNGQIQKGKCRKCKKVVYRATEANRA